MRPRTAVAACGVFTAMAYAGLWAASSHSYLGGVQPGFGQLPLGDRMTYSFRYIGAQVAVETGEKHAVTQLMEGLQRRINQHQLTR